MSEEVLLSEKSWQSEIILDAKTPELKYEQKMNISILILH